MQLSDSPVRSAKAVPLAATMTAGLLVLMTALIAIDDDLGPEDYPPLDMDIYQTDATIEDVLRSNPPPLEAIRPKRIPIPEVVISVDTNTDIQTPIKFDHSLDNRAISFTKGSGKGFFNGTFGPGNGDQAARVEHRIQPRYPSGAESNGVEGYVDLQFDITPQGTTTNIQVIASNPKRIFDRSAIQAMKKWKYKPQLVDGKPVTVSGATTRMIFTLEKQ